jgi:hypothetical protein
MGNYSIALLFSSLSILTFWGVTLMKIQILTPDPNLSTMLSLPNDILDKIDQDFELEDKQEIRELLSQYYAYMNGFGPTLQAMRGMIFFG